MINKQKFKYIIIILSLPFLFSFKSNLVHIEHNSISSMHLYDQYGCAKLVNNLVKCWGLSTLGSIDQSNTEMKAYPPTTVKNSQNISKIALGQNLSCILNTNGEVKCVGGSGYSGNGTWNTVNVYTLISGSDVASDISTTQGHGCYLANNQVKCWGPNILNGWYISPTLIPNITSATKVVVGPFTTCIIDSGSLKCLGLNTGGQLGDGTTVDKFTPTQVYGLTSGVTDVAISPYRGGSADRVCAIANGEVKCWGGGGGYLGDGISTQSLIPITIPNISNAVKVTIGAYHTCVMISDGSLKCWGGNYFGSGTSSLTPISVTTPDGAISDVQAESYGTCIVSASTNRIKCVGDNPNYSLGIKNGWITTPVYTSPKDL